MTLQEILNRIDSRYENGVSVSDKIFHINTAQDEISKFFGRYIEDTTSLVTVASQERYDYPTGLADISDIVMLEIANTATPTVDGDYDEYTLSPMVDKSRNGRVFYDAFQTTLGVRQFGVYPIPSTNALKFRIRYQQPLPELVITDMTAEPQFDSRYHDALVSYALYKVCASGAFPDERMANVFADEWNSALEELYRFYGNQKATAPRRRRDNRWWHSTNARRAKY